MSSWSGTGDRNGGNTAAVVPSRGPERLRDGPAVHHLLPGVRGVPPGVLGDPGLPPVEYRHADGMDRTEEFRASDKRPALLHFLEEHRCVPPDPHPPPGRRRARLCPPPPLEDPWTRVLPRALFPACRRVRRGRHDPLATDVFL